MAGVRSAHVNWSPSADSGAGPASAFIVKASPGSASARVSGTTATVAGLDDGTTYTFTVTASNGGGTSPSSEPSNAITTPDVPGAPTGVTAAAVRREPAATLSWNAPASDGGRPLTGYTVVVSPPAPSAVISVSGTTAVVSGLAFGTAYTFQVAAVNAVGTSAGSGASNAVTPMPNQAPVLDVSGPTTYPVGAYALPDATRTFDPDGDPVSFAWTLTSVPPGSEAVLYDAGTPRPSFLADRRGSFLLTLIATDGTASSTASIWISAGDVVIGPEEPVITIAPGTTVRFDAQCTFGRWFTNGGYGPFGDPPGTEWPFPDHADFTFYDVGVFSAWGECDAFYDEPYASFSRTVIVQEPSTAVAISPARPVREIGGGPLELTAAVGGVPAAVDWSLSEATGTLSAGSGETVTYVPPNQGSPPRLVTLTATSASGDSASVEILLTATPPPRTNHPPVARIASFGTALVGTAVALDARASFDPDGDPLRWTWELTGVPQGSAAFIADPGAEVTTFVPDVSGSYQVTLTVDDGYGGTATVTAVVTGSEPPAAIVPLSALAQVTGAGKAVADPPSVRVTDRNGYPVAGVEVLFQVTAGGGSVTGSPAYTSASGAATAVEWTVGGDGAQEVVAQVAGQPELSVAFTATARAPYAGYDVSLQFLTSASDPVVRAFNRARARIEEIITGDLPDVYFGTGLNACGYLLSGATDDLFIGVEVANIDGAGGILGQAGPCLIRTSSSLPAFGIMRFDAADLAVMEADGTLDSVILHEMLHVVGIGTIWESLGLLQGAGGADPVFLGAGATEAFLAFNGGPTYAGAPVPVENTGGSGTQDSHWRESVFGRELMTGWIGGATNPLSRTTIGSLADLGYSVQLDAAEPFDISAALRLPGPAPVRMDEVILKPTHGIDDAGRLTPLAQ